MTRDHAFRRGPYRDDKPKRKSLGPKVTVLSPVLIALLITFVGLPLVGGLIAFAFFTKDLPVRAGHRQGAAGAVDQGLRPRRQGAPVPVRGGAPGPRPVQGHPPGPHQRHDRVRGPHLLHQPGRRRPRHRAGRSRRSDALQHRCGWRVDDHAAAREAPARWQREHDHPEDP